MGKIEVLSNILKTQTGRKLTWFGQITAIKSLAISTFNYTISSLESPGWFAQDVKLMLENFMWEGKYPRVNTYIIQNKIEDGVPRMINLDFYFMAQNANWILKKAA